MRLKNIIPLLSLLVACSTGPGGTVSGSQAGQPAAGSSASQPSATQPVSTQPAPTLTQPAGQVSPAAAPLILTVLSPLNEASVSEAQINLTGSVSRPAVLTVNSDIHLLPAGDFSIPVTLEEGPNLLEIIASDTDGNETNLILVVTYQP